MMAKSKYPHAGRPPANEEKPPEVPADGRKDNSLNRLKRIEYKLEHLDERLTDVLQSIENIPEAAPVADERSSLVDPEQMRYLLKEVTAPIGERLQKLSVQVTDLHKRMEDFEAGAAAPKALKRATKPVPEEVLTHPFYPMFKRLSERIRAYLTAHEATHPELLEAFNGSPQAKQYHVSIRANSVISLLARSQFHRDPATGNYHPGVSFVKYRALDEWLTAEGF